MSRAALPPPHQLGHIQKCIWLVTLQDAVAVVQVNRLVLLGWNQLLTCKLTDLPGDVAGTEWRMMELACLRVEIDASQSLALDWHFLAVAFGGEGGPVCDCLALGIRLKNLSLRQLSGEFVADFEVCCVISTTWVLYASRGLEGPISLFTCLEFNSDLPRAWLCFIVDGVKIPCHELKLLH